MNKYAITTFSRGTAQTIIVTAYDMSAALCMANQQEVIKIELVGTTDVVDTTA